MESKWNDSLHAHIRGLNFDSIPTERKATLSVLIDSIKTLYDQNQPIRLNFICTHNSRRSQFAQVWAYCAAHYYKVDIESYSGGVEVTAFNERAIQSLERFGFNISSNGNGNPKYHISTGTLPTLQCFSKTFDDPSNNPNKSFIAVMTCAHADENCPYIPNASERIAVRYEDPKAFDDTPEEAKMYDHRSRQIATEMFYVFSHLIDS